MSLTKIAAGRACRAHMVAAVSTALWCVPVFGESPRFEVANVQIEGNTLLPDATLRSLADPLGGGSTTIDELRRTASKIQDLYRKEGYGGVVAFVPEQSFADGKVVIRVLEGKVARVSVRGNREFSSDNILSGVPHVREGETPQVNAINRDIQLSNENPAKRLRVALAPGSGPGDIDVNIDVTDRNPLRWLAGLNNTGDDRSGNYRLSLGVQHANLFGLDHVGTAQYQTSPGEPGRVNLYSVGYRVPLYRQAMAIDAFLAHSSVDSGTTLTPAGPLDFAGQGDVLGLRAHRYLDRRGEYDHRVTFGVDWRSYDNECTLGSFGAAGCGTAASSVDVVPLNVTYIGQVQTPSTSWGISVGISHNVGGSSTQKLETARAGAAADYLIWRVQGFVEQALSADVSVKARMSAQHTANALISGEQFGLGGMDSVRGYQERDLAGDSGLLASLELTAGDLGSMLGLTGWQLRPLVFVDAGTVRNSKGAACRTAETRCALASAGFGLRLSIAPGVSGRLDYAYALENGNRSRAGDHRAHFSLQLAY